MNLILELPTYVGTIQAWALTKDIRKLAPVTAAHCVVDHRFAGAEIWIEINDNADRFEQTSIANMLSMLVRDVATTGGVKLITANERVLLF